jgi:RimJ/RimL family protein N-acetyltransferase
VTGQAAVTVRPATLAELQTLESDRKGFAEMIGSAVPDNWPVKHEMFSYAVERLSQHPEDASWLIYFFFDHAGSLVGSGGNHGPPVNRNVEIGYEIAPAVKGRKLGSAAAARLVDRAFATGAVDTVIAKTVADEENPSVTILKRLGFRFVTPLPDPESGGQLWWWELEAPKIESH